MKPIINKKLMVFQSDPDFADNPRGLWEYVVKNTDYETFWIIQDPKLLSLLKENGVKCDSEGSELSNSMIETAQFLISSSFHLSYNKRAEQIHVSAWHGLALKVIGFFDSATTDSNQFEGLKIITTQTDLMTSTSRLTQLLYSGLFSMDPRKVKETGMPRNDLMFHTNAKDNLQKITNIDVKNSKLLFYLPTVRKGLKDEGAIFDENIFNYPDYNPDSLDLLLEKNNAYIFVKLHFADNDYFTKGDFQLPKRMIFLDTNILNEHFFTLYHLVDAFDSLITDYSSIFIDYMLLDKPIVFSCPDIENYKKDRGFLVDDPKLLMPGPIVYTQKELEANLSNIFVGEDLYRSEREEKMSLFHSNRDALSSMRLLSEMEKAASAGTRDAAKDYGYLFSNKTSPLSQYTKKCYADFYFDTGNGFSEANKLTKEYNIGEKSEPTIFEVELPANTVAIRFDPDEFGRCALKNFSATLDGTLQEFQLIHGDTTKNYIFFHELDPQILIPCSSQNAKKIVIQYKCIDLCSEAGQTIKVLTDAWNNELQETNSRWNAEVQSLINSRSWKLTKPLRKIRRIFKK